MIYVISAIFLIFFVLPAVIVKRRYEKLVRDSLKWLVKNYYRLLPFSTTRNYGIGKGLIFCPHPFTNWSLNPSHHNRLDESQHTVEGFRKAEEADSALQLVKDHPGAYKIVCVGSSSTYCTYVDRYQDSWPFLLKDKIAKEKTLVFNFGISGWGILQSLVRSLTWLPLIRPDLVLFYQAFNDLKFSFHGHEKEKTILPDYQNLITQFSELLTPVFPGYMYALPLVKLIEVRKLARVSFAGLYKPRPLKNIKGLARFDDKLLEGILFKLESLLLLCETLGCKVLYIPEIVRKIDRDREEFIGVLNKIYGRVPEVVKRHKNAGFLDPRGMVPESEEYFVDALHFSRKGCDLFSDILAGHINGKVL